MSIQPSNGNSSLNGFFGNIGDVFGEYSNSVLRLLAAKSLVDINDGEFGLQIDPMNGTMGVRPTTTTGSVAPRSIWQSYDMLFIGVAAVLVVGALAFKD